MIRRCVGAIRDLWRGFVLPAGRSTRKHEKLGGTGGTRGCFYLLLPVLQGKARELPRWDFEGMRWDIAEVRWDIGENRWD